MARKKQEPEKKKKVNTDGIMGLHGSTTEQAISETLELNYMPYAMSVIVSRAIPEIDGFKPSHRKLLYTMYKMGLLTGGRTKSANIVGQTMRLNPHGDAAIYETMVRLAKGNETLLHPFVDSKGNFGKVYSRDMAYAAARYTEAKLDPICAEVFKDIDSDTVDMVDNYDATMKEPALLPTTFPNVLVSANQGIAVGMASNICSFNLREVCDTAIALMKNPDHDILETLPGPDFSTGGELLFDEAATREIYATGRGSFKLRAKWRYVKDGNLIEITEIPYTTATEVIMDKVAELIKAGKIKEIADMRDETDLGGLKLTIDLKRGVDPEKLMQKLFRLTPLQDSFGGCRVTAQAAVSGGRERDTGRAGATGCVNGVGGGSADCKACHQADGENEGNDLLGVFHGKILLCCFENLILDGDCDDCPGRADNIAGFGVKIVEHGCAFVCASWKLHIKGSTFDLAAHRDCVALVDLFAGVIADELHLLRVIVDRFVDDHDIALRCAVFKVRRGVHRNIDHAFRDLFVQLLRYFFRRKVVPAALNGSVVINDARLGTVLGLGRLADQTDGSKNADRNRSGKADNGEDDEGSGLCVPLFKFVHSCFPF